MIPRLIASSRINSEGLIRVTLVPRTPRMQSCKPELCHLCFVSVGFPWIVLLTEYNYVSVHIRGTDKAQSSALPVTDSCGVLVLEINALA
jgi:hypothetical protein